MSAQTNRVCIVVAPRCGYSSLRPQGIDANLSPTRLRLHERHVSRSVFHPPVSRNGHLAGSVPDLWKYLKQIKRVRYLTQKGGFESTKKNKLPLRIFFFAWIPVPFPGGTDRTFRRESPAAPSCAEACKTGVMPPSLRMASLTTLWRHASCPLCSCLPKVFQAIAISGSFLSFVIQGVTFSPSAPPTNHISLDIILLKCYIYTLCIGTREDAARNVVHSVAPPHSGWPKDALRRTGRADRPGRQR
jgi:hypothetical protein